MFFRTHVGNEFFAPSTVGRCDCDRYGTRVNVFGRFVVMPSSAQVTEKSQRLAKNDVNVTRQKNIAPKKNFGKTQTLATVVLRFS